LFFNENKELLDLEKYINKIVEYIGRGSIHHVEEVDSSICFPFLLVVYSNVGRFSLGHLVLKRVFKLVITMKIQLLGVVPSHHCIVGVTG
jgi:hypothetical protein